MKRLFLAAALALSGCGERHVESVEWQGDPVFVRRFIPASLPVFFDCLRERGDVLVSAHRGGRYPGMAENAIATFEATLAQGPAFLEIDIARTRDGALVLMHDDTVDRTTNGSGRVDSLSLEAFRELRLRDSAGALLDAHPPTLREALDWAAGRTVLELDIKRGVAFEDVIAEVRAANAMSRVAFITYSTGAAARLAQLAPEALIYTSISTVRELDTLTRRGVDLDNIVAWVGTDAPDRALLSALAARGVESRLGMFGRDRAFGEARRASVQVVAADDAREAIEALDEADGEEGHAVLQCVAAR